MQKLKIKGNALLVYAAIYSFSMGEMGVYFGTQAWLAGVLNINLRTLERALKLLREMKLIENTERAAGIRGVRICDKTLEEICKGEECSERDEETGGEVSDDEEFEAPDLKTREEAIRREEARNERIARRYIEEIENPEIRARSAAEIFADITDRELQTKMSEGERNLTMLGFKYEEPNTTSKFLALGKKSYVRMTEPQYRHLLTLLPAEDLMPYLMKVEHMMEQFFAGRSPLFPRNHYRTIKNWITADTAL